MVPECQCDREVLVATLGGMAYLLIGGVSGGILTAVTIIICKYSKSRDGKTISGTIELQTVDRAVDVSEKTSGVDFETSLS